MSITFFYLDKLIDNIDNTGMFFRDCKHFISYKELSKYNNEVGVVLIEKRLWENQEDLVFDLIKRYSNNTKLSFMLCDTSEGYPTKHLYYPFFEFLEKCNIDKKRRLLLYNNAIQQNSLLECDIFYSVYFPSFLYEFANIVSIKPNNSAPKYDFSCFNRKSKEHKYETVKEIVKRNLDCATTFDFFNDTDFNHNSFLKLESIREGSYLIESDYFLGKINICTESEFYSTYHDKSSADAEHQWGDMIHLTEKVFRNISWGIPYVLVSSKGSLNEIRRLGFKTFDSIIDESYDMADDSIRMELALDAADELLKKYNTDEMNSILKYNIDKIESHSHDSNLFNIHLFDVLKNHINNLDI